MGKEIEKKFLVRNKSYRECATSCQSIAQAYLSLCPDSTVRVRTKGNKGYLTVKTRNIGAERNEWEYEIPFADAQAMLKEAAVSPLIEKVRYRCGRWEIDEFLGCLEGLTVAEIELESADESFSLPSYIGKEVTGDSRYYNSSLSQSGKIPEEVEAH